MKAPREAFTENLIASWHSPSDSPFVLILKQITWTTTHYLQPMDYVDGNIRQQLQLCTCDCAKREENHCILIKKDQHKLMVLCL